MLLQNCYLLLVMMELASTKSSDKLPMGWTTGLALWTALRARLLSSPLRNITANTAAVPALWAPARQWSRTV